MKKIDKKYIYYGLIILFIITLFNIPKILPKEPVVLDEVKLKDIVVDKNTTYFITFKMDTRFRLGIRNSFYKE